MKMNVNKQYTFLLMLIFICIFLLSGCTVPTMSDSSKGNLQQVVDETGVTVEIPASPSRIVSFGVSTDDILIPLVGTERILAVSELPSNWEKEKDLIKGRVKNSTELILSFKPDLVVVPNWVSPDFIHEMRQMKLPVYVYKTPTKLEETRKLILQLATVLKEEEKGKQIVKDIDTRLKAVEELTKAHKGEKKIALYYTASGMTGGKDSTFNDLCEYAHLTNGGALLGLVRGEKVSNEGLLKINPDIIFIPSNAYDSGKYKTPGVEQLYKDEAFKDIKAIRNRQVYVVDARWIMSYSQFMVNAIEEMARTAYQN